MQCKVLQSRVAVKVYLLFLVKMKLFQKGGTFYLFTYLFAFLISRFLKPPLVWHCLVEVNPKHHPEDSSLFTLVIKEVILHSPDRYWTKGSSDTSNTCPFATLIRISRENVSDVKGGEVEGPQGHKDDHRKK